MAESTVKAKFIKYEYNNSLVKALLRYKLNSELNCRKRHLKFNDDGLTVFF